MADQKSKNNKGIQKSTNGHRRSNSRVNETFDDSKFKTDSDISGKFQIRERDLQKWVPDEDSPVLTLDESSSSGQWDQFKVNEEKFGVESSYDEHLYTTRINKLMPDYRKRVEAAAKLAKEIEGQSSSDRHVLEERGVVVDDSGMDEEDKYSGVDRRGDELMAALRNASISSNSPKNFAPGKYVPPKHRAAQYHDDPAIVSSSATKTKPDSVPSKPPVGQQNESFRLNAQSEINSLREFSANFKIPHKMPTDLLPILSKDKLKQDEILKKQKETAHKKAEEAKKLLSPQLQKKKMDPTKPAFKLNPKAAAFTPLPKHPQISPNPPKLNYNARSPNNPSPRINNSRPYSSGSVSGNSSSGAKRHYQISPADFFGGADKIPTKASQEAKTRKFKSSFNLFLTAQKNHTDKSIPISIGRAYQTPPTWDFTFDQTHDKLFPPLASILKSPQMMVPNAPGMSFMPSPMMEPNHPGQIPAGGKYPMSPQQQQAAVAMAYQQQQFHAAMMYQQQFQGAPPGQIPMGMYGPGGEQFMPPGQYVMSPQFGGSPVNANMMMGQMDYENNYQGRRYLGKRNSNK